MGCILPAKPFASSVERAGFAIVTTAVTLAVGPPAARGWSTAATLAAVALRSSARPSTDGITPVIFVPLNVNDALLGARATPFATAARALLILAVSICGSKRSAALRAN